MALDSKTNKTGPAGATDKPDTGEAATSTAAADVKPETGKTPTVTEQDLAGMTPEQRAAFEQNAVATMPDAPAGNPKPADGNSTVNVVVEQAPPEPAVYYGEDAEHPAPRDHVRADYKPFVW